MRQKNFCISEFAIKSICNKQISVGSALHNAIQNRCDGTNICNGQRFVKRKICV